MMKLLFRWGALVGEEGQTYKADNDGDSDEARWLRPLQAVTCVLWIAFEPRADQRASAMQRGQAGFAQAEDTPAMSRGQLEPVAV